MTQLSMKGKDVDQLLKNMDKTLEFLKIKDKERNLLPLKEDIYIKLRKLMEIDQELCRTVADARDIPASRPHNNIQVGDVIISGSCGEGCMLARWFKGKPKFVPVNEQPKVTVRDMSENVAQAPTEHVNVCDLIQNFLVGPAKHTAEKYPDQAKNLKLVGAELLQMVFPPSSNTNRPAEHSAMTTNMNILQSPRMFDQREAMKGTNTAPEPPSGENTQNTEDHIPKDDPWEMEVDVMAKMAYLTKDCMCLLEPVEGRLAYVKVPFHESIKKCVVQRVWNKMEKHRRRHAPANQSLFTIDTNGYFDPWKIKKLVGIYTAFRDSDNSLPLLLSWIFGVPAINIKVAVESEPTKTSHQLTIKARLIHNFFLNVAADLVACFHVDGWPGSVGDKWINREGIKWPDESEIMKIIKDGCYLVPRPSDGKSETNEFRWSFSMAEQALVKLMKTSQRRTYFLFKMMFYRYIIPLHDQLCSYMTKTTMLWACQQFPPAHAIWSDDAVFHSVHYLLLKLQFYFHSGHLPMFFIPEINLLEDIPRETHGIIAKKIASIRTNLVQNVPFDIPQVITSAKIQSTALRQMAEILKMTQDSMISAFAASLVSNVTGNIRAGAYHFDEYWNSEAERFYTEKSEEPLDELDLVCPRDDTDVSGIIDNMDLD